MGPSSRCSKIMIKISSGRSAAVIRAMADGEVLVVDNAVENYFFIESSRSIRSEGLVAASLAIVVLNLHRCRTVSKK